MNDKSQHKLTTASKEGNMRHTPIPNVGSGEQSAGNRELSSHIDVDFIDTGEIWNAIRRSRVAIIASVVIFVILGLIYSQILRPVYTAKATIKVTSNKNLVDVGGDVEMLIDQSWVEENTAKVRLLSIDLGGQVIRDAELDNTPEYLGQLGQFRIPFLSSKKSGRLSRIDQTSQPAEVTKVDLTTGDSVSNFNSMAGAIYASNISSVHIESTNLLELSFSSFDPNNAAKVLNQIAKTYNELEEREERLQSQIALDRLNDELVVVQKRLRDSERKLTDYSRRADIADIEGTNNFSEREIASLQEELLLIKSRRRAIEVTKHSENDEARRADSNLLADDSFRLRELETQLDRMLIERDKLAQTFSNKYPSLRELNLQIRTIQAQINQQRQSQKISRSDELENTRDRELEIRTEIAAKQRQLLNLKDRSVEYNILKREWDSNKIVYDALLDKVKRAGLASNLMRKTMTLIQPASVPRNKSFPNTNKYVFSMASIGLILGLALAFFRHLRDRRFKSIESLERYANLPVMGVIPMIRSNEHVKRQNIALQTSNNPQGLLAESYRSLCTNIIYSANAADIAEEADARVIMVTSSEPAEAKTSSVINLASAMAISGYRTVILDFDLRRPTLHKVFGLQRSPGVTDRVTNTDQQINIRGAAQENLYLVSAGGAVSNSVKVLESSECRKMVNDLKPNFDFILIDSPPVLGLADSVILSQYADLVLMTVDLGKSNRSVLGNALTRLTRVDSPLTGLIVTKFLKEQVSDYRYGDAYYDYMYQYQDTDELPNPSKKISLIRGKKA